AFDPQTLIEAEGNLLPTARRFEEGTMNFPVIVALGESIKLINDRGVDNIAVEIKQLTDLLIDGLEECRCRVVSPREGETWSGIVSFVHPSIDSDELNAWFLERNIVTSVRNGWLRVAVHFFNDEEEIGRLLEALKSRTF
ncbi:MAG: aminotransferase class V-fold PLP-dependent enzyme, partial [Candidatus Obscuribacterales bacterium]|nr:aminotransferase class V-fold PLP-dependent enzyme [Candidatus Obscuribacterales bacterium]